MAVTFSKLQAPDLLGRIQDNIVDAFARCVSTAGLVAFTTADPTGTPTTGSPRFVVNTKNLRLWVNVAGTSWHFVGLT